MRYEQMTEALRERVPMEPGSAETVLSATVQAVGEVSSTTEMADLRSQLPEPLDTVAPVVPGEDRSLDETVMRVADLTGAADAEQARGYLQAGFAVIAQAVTAGQLRQLMDTLGSDYQQLSPGSVGLSGDAETFVAQLRSRAGLSTNEDALLVVQVVLSTLGEHISEGQADNLARNLPTELSRELSTRTAAPASESEPVLDGIRRRAKLPDRETAQRMLQAVAAVVQEWAPGELADAVRQLPSDLSRLINA